MRFVLVRPRDPNNIGAAARAMANFGLEELVVVDPWEPHWREARAAVGAAHVLERARAVTSLAEAIGDRTLVAATTAGTRRALDRVVTPVEFFDEVAREAAWERAALLFGNEKHGLAADDLARCHALVRIPTGDLQPSMNLAAAVAVCAYQATVARGAGTLAAPPRRRAGAATVAELDALVAAAFPGASDPRVESRRRGGRERLRTLLLRARATRSDLALLRGRLVQPESDNG